jgi:hypothetical protein
MEDFAEALALHGMDVLFNFDLLGNRVGSEELQVCGMKTWVTNTGLGVALCGLFH